ncbi:DUF4433 domain-containing protein [Sphingomonas sp. So64.6b]|uniref:DarT ssDNA thymidine ADP-ribosyltransferase family protein n=1 Tax=Sphingomonas sp. So64.6b TaxID=2997354 RepID=UPI0016044D58|nr:DarT ssDNA thymidine ADP-ribosyltransferase family protein [Sphingomonas sp. So64.6b]QNA83784.1 DUF4433 domain-containing protein [Sphingomonas sp. So64.6b]
MAKARQNEVLFPDWVVLFVKPHHLEAEGTLFSPRNAAAGCGRHLAAGVDAFDAMFPASLVGAYDRTLTRLPRHLPCSPTDDQAEVLVRGRIPAEDIIGIGVSTNTQGLEERLRLEYCGVDVHRLNFVVAPELFDKTSLSRAIRSGKRPVETSLAS